MLIIYLSGFIGLLFPTFLVSRFFLFIVKRWMDGWQLLAFSHALSFIVITLSCYMAIKLLSAIGMLDGRMFPPLLVTASFILPQCFWLAYDAYYKQ